MIKDEQLDFDQGRLRQHHCISRFYARLDSKKEASLVIAGETYSSFVVGIDMIGSVDPENLL
ncbi:MULTISPECIES: hypothetical protein [unclassified Rhizobium]|jgi:hypothetical protein|uniref:hypothetical protein n=1 Tax=unclassified Rhizobium TaxID=2613769 RepID=UPI000645EF76|nr:MULTISPECIES: hypothetical protein [unclassified Rhizobium]OJY66251.1 MAG: hypothetical protein BGP09_30370 [Rhizobium sp. 60-20]